MPRATRQNEQKKWNLFGEEQDLNKVQSASSDFSTVDVIEESKLNPFTSHVSPKNPQLNRDTQQQYGLVAHLPDGLFFFVHAAVRGLLLLLPELECALLLVLVLSEHAGAMADEIRDQEHARVVAA